MILKGIIQVTGPHDTGKTSFALGCGAHPKSIAFFDDDIKGRATVQDFQEAGVEFGAYHDLVELEGRCDSMLEFHLHCKTLIESMKDQHYDAIIWDTWSRFAKTCHSYVMANLKDFRRPQEWSAMGKIKAGEQWQEARRYEARLLQYLNHIAPTVIIVTHLKDFYLNNGKVPGVQVPASSKAIDRICRARVWLNHNPKSPVPIGLFLKRFDRKVVTDAGIRTRSVVPRKVVPREGDDSLWDAIWRYWDEPVGNRELTDDEKPDAFELSVLDGVLTKEQKRIFELMLEKGLIEPEPDEMLPEERVPGDWKELLAMTETGPGDWGGIGKLKAMGKDEIAEAWGERG